MTEVRVPTLGESVTEATVATWFKKSGDAVQQDEMLCELETDKVTVEVPAPASGVLAEIVAAEGATVNVDALLASIAEGGAPAVAPAAQAAPAEKPSAGNETATTTEIAVPTLGESVSEATVAAWFKAVGDSVAVDEILCELETDKVSVEVPAPAAGVIVSISAAEGATVAAGGVLGAMSAGGGTVSTQAAAAPVAAASATGGKSVEDAPSAKKIMAEKNIDPSSVSGSGRDGRVMKSDVMNASSGSKASAPTPERAPVTADDASREERVKMTRLRQTIARRLKDAQNSAAMLTTYNEVDMGAIMALRKEYKDLFLKKHGVKLGFMSFFTKACCHALGEVPDVNAEIDGDHVVYKNFVNMGVAVGTPNGLVVPVIRNADAMGFASIEKAINEMGTRARDGKLSMAEMQGGTFTISNGGVYGSLMSSPILNPPQSGILGMHKIQDR